MSLETILRQNLKNASPVHHVIKLHGDASYRTYSRITLDNGQTFIALQMPLGKASASEEITNFRGTITELPFLNIGRFLKERGLPVPAIHHYSTTDRIMILEDLGDRLFLQEVAEQPATKQQAWYQRAVDLIVQLQIAARHAPPAACIALQRSFDETLLSWEFDHFLEYGLEARGVNVSEADKKLFLGETRAISRKIATLPQVFVHRDFQSKNLIIRDDVRVDRDAPLLSILDFQDALMGPAVYDLVALLRDSYVDIAWPLADELIARYAGQTNADANRVRQDFHLVTIQRKLKDAGRFVYIDRVKGNPNFLGYIPRTLGYVREAFEQLPEYKKLYDLLKKYVSEWRTA